MGTYFNNAKCDVYIGKGAGKKLLHDFRNATNKIKVISPYLSANIIENLIRIHNEGVSIELITTDEIEDYKEPRKKIIQKLIIQNKKTDIIAKEKREQLKKFITYMNYIIGFLFSILIISFCLQKDSKLFYGLILIIILMIINYNYKSKYRRIRVFSYSYSKLFPFKVYYSPYKNKASKTFIHSKIYIIDDKIAYLGSLNLTKKGTEDNYETRIRTVDSELINTINKEFEELYFHSNIPERDIEYWGKQIYREPRN